MFDQIGILLFKAFIFLLKCLDELPLFLIFLPQLFDFFFYRHIDRHLSFVIGMSVALAKYDD
ncbi:hypothetical protein [Lacticaseibacillus chiayiensis]|uniref:hypothetical protein n=1 Tax=Lacticaseibacillus chiayiensis TaxID=2100821 RepID=UPI001EDCC5AC|nr:hypothetical protein [Lacticaseibacillus chiayiensis]